MFINIDPSEQATIAAALRFYHDSGLGDPARRNECIHELATAKDKVVSLDQNAVRQLQRKIMAAEEKAKADLVVVKDDQNDDYVRVFAPASLDLRIDVLDLNDPDHHRCNDDAHVRLLDTDDHPEYPGFKEVSL